MSKDKKIGLSIIGILLIIFVIAPAIAVAMTTEEEWKQIRADIEREKAQKLIEQQVKEEPKFDQPLQLSREWQDADTLRELRKVGQITPEEECRVILNLIRDSRNDAYLFEFWNQFLEEECR